MTLSGEHVRAQLPEGWEGDEHGIEREFTFGSDAAGVAFALRVALHAEQTDHHPDLLIAWRKVRVRDVTHSAGGVTEKDLSAARSVNAFP